MVSGCTLCIRKKIGLGPGDIYIRKVYCIFNPEPFVKSVKKARICSALINVILYQPLDFTIG